MIDMDNLLQETFIKMVKEIRKTVSSELQPHRYHETSSIAEINTVYQFVKILDKEHEECVVYFEFPCDSGRIDAVVVLENNILLIEAKSDMNPKKSKELDAQALRFINTNAKAREQDWKKGKEEWLWKYNDDSLRSTLKERIPKFINKKWDASSSDISVFGILLADTTKKNQVERWKNMETDAPQYILDITNKYKNNIMTAENNIIKNWWHLGAYRKLENL